MERQTDVVDSKCNTNGIKTKVDLVLKSLPRVRHFLYDMPTVEELDSREGPQSVISFN